MACPQLDFRLLASRTETRNFCSSKPPILWYCVALGGPKETNAAWESVRAAELPRRKTQAWGPAPYSATREPSFGPRTPALEEKGAGFGAAAPSCLLRLQGAHSHVQTNHPINGQPFSIWSLCCFQAAASQHSYKCFQEEKCHSFSQQLQKH